LGRSPAEAAALAAKKGVNVFTISFSDEANQFLMKSIAAAGRGKHIHATSSSELADAFADIARTLPTLLTH
jgi:alkanesulfonate monooxygenase SsuD/methylene tetrahydromethanopterin reductase-like flavin-dependent oxidoreductase (luciferase family)